MGKLIVNEKEIVVPGEVIAEGMDFIPSNGTYRKGEKIYSNVLGLFEKRDRVLRVIPLSGKYMPAKGDMVIGIVREVGFSGWQVDINGPVNANLPIGEAVRERIDLLTAEISKYYDIGDIIYAKVLNVTNSRIYTLTMKEPTLKKLRGGRIIKITHSKVPRLIGKKGSMISLIKEKTGCKIIVGQNGYIWLSGPAEKQFLVEKVVSLIEKEAHTSGLTDKVSKILEEGVKNE